MLEEESAAETVLYMLLVLLCYTWASSSHADARHAEINFTSLPVQPSEEGGLAGQGLATLHRAYTFLEMPFT